MQSNGMTRQVLSNATNADAGTSSDGGIDSESEILRFLRMKDLTKWSLYRKTDQFMHCRISSGPKPRNSSFVFLSLMWARNSSTEPEGALFRV